MGGDADFGDIIKIVVVILFLAGPLLRSVFKAFFKPNQQQQQGPRKKIHEVLDEMRRDVAKKAQEGAGPDAPPARRAPDPLDPLQEPVRPRPPRREPQAPRRRAQELPQAPRPERMAPAPKRQPSLAADLKKIDQMESVKFKPIEGIESSRFKELSSFETVLPSAGLPSSGLPSQGAHATDHEPRSGRRRRKLRVAGMNAKQLIIAGVILGPPRCREPRRDANG